MTPLLGLWLTKDGRLMAICNMTDEHLSNCLLMFRRMAYERQKQEGKLRERGYPVVEAICNADPVDYCLAIYPKYGELRASAISRNIITGRNPRDHDLVAHYVKQYREHGVGSLYDPVPAGLARELAKPFRSRKVKKARR